MNVVIVGGGKVGSYLGQMLQESGNEVTIVEQRKEQCARIAEFAPGIKIVCGDGCEPYVLDEAALSKADSVVAATGHDEDNLVVCLLGKYEYSVDHSIARINNPKNEWLFKERFGVDIALSNTHMIAKILQEEVILGDLVTLLKLRTGNLALVEIRIQEDCRAAGMTVTDLGLPADTVLVAIIRDDSVIVPQGSTKIELNDEILALTSPESEATLANCLGTSKQKK